MTTKSSGNFARFFVLVVALGIVVVSVALNLMVQTLVVSTDEMEPTLPAGSRVIAFVASEAKLDDIILLRHPQQPQTIVVRRVAAVGDDHYSVVADNREQAKDFGPVPRKNLIARVRWVFVWPGGLRKVPATAVP